MTDLRGLLSMLKQRIRIPMSPHIHAGGPKMPLDNLLLMRAVGELALSKKIEEADQSDMIASLVHVPEQQIRSIHRKFGEEGVFKLNFLAAKSNRGDFKQFYDIIRSELLFEAMRDGGRDIALEPDNASMRSSPDLDRFSHNVVNSSLSRKLFNPGVGEGYLVYGIGGPRILVSLPFIGANKFFYDVFSNSLDVVTSLMMRGYFGSFLLLDSVEGLNSKYFGQPAWLLWFSIIAAHSDLIIFVKEEGNSLSDAQKLEIAYTPDRVGKKLVELPRGELSWAKKDDTDPSTDIIYVDPERGIISRVEWEKMSRQMAGPFVESYERGSFPNDRLIVLHEEGRISEHPLQDATSPLSS